MTARIEWNPRTLVRIQPGGGYARILRLPGGELLCAYSFAGKVWVRPSRDNGRTWRDPVLVASWAGGHLTNAEMLLLRNGALLFFYNQRPGRGAEPLAYAICMARSEDGGRNWGPSVTLYRGGAEFSNGCWEPAAVETPAREVQVFFANESPYRRSAEQEITLLRSHDGARTWGAPERVIFRAGSRDGMPVPLVLQNGRGIAVSIEDNGLSGNFKPVIAFTTLRDNWRSGTIDGPSERRWSALQTPLAPPVYAGAPYLRQMPTGETILSFQQSDSGDMNRARIVVCVGDADARNFANPTHPFPETLGAAQLWASLFVKDRQTITAICDTRIGGVGGVWAIDGRLVARVRSA